MNTPHTQTVKLNVLLKLDEIKADLRAIGYQDGDAVWDELRDLRKHAAREFDAPGFAEGYTPTSRE